MRRTVLVTTTIRVPTFLRDVCENFIRHGKADVSCLVIGDVKTPSEARRFCEETSQAFHVPITYLDIPDQERALSDFPEFQALMPLNSGSRKLIGNFLAYLEGCETLIMLDDDNFVTGCDFLGLHQIVGTAAPMDLIESPSGWYNICEALEEERGIPFYPRGYPWSRRSTQRSAARRLPSTLPVIVNNGLVLEDPDIDAISRLFWPIRVTGMRPEFEPSFGLRPGTWAPFNNQNTALSREAIPVFFTPPSTGRNSDIWAAYVLCRLAEHLEGVIAFGAPLVRQLRNPHDLWRDLEDERVNNRATDRFVALLRETPLTASTYPAALGELLGGSLDRLASLQGLPADQLEMMRRFLVEYQVWHELCAGAVRC